MRVFAIQFSPTCFASICCSRANFWRERVRFGFTLVEVLVVLAILGLLISIALVALNRARESSRGVQCRNNLRQFGLAALAYEGSKKHLPPGTIGFGQVVPVAAFMGDTNSPNYRRRLPHTSFQGLLLPYMEQQSLYDSLGATLTRAHATSVADDGWFASAEGFVSASINAPDYTRCPVDSLLAESNESIMFGTHPVLAQNMDRFTGEKPEMLPESIRPVDQHRGTNYAGSSGVYSGVWPGRPNAGLGGAMTAGSHRRLAEIRDGVANTYLIGEILGFNWDTQRVRLSWLIGGLARARGDVPPGESPDAFAEVPNLYLGDRVFSSLGGFGSLHGGGVNFVMADGSTQTIARDIGWEVHLRFASIADAGGDVWE